MSPPDHTLMVIFLRKCHKHVKKDLKFNVSPTVPAGPPPAYAPPGQPIEPPVEVFDRFV